MAAAVGRQLKEGILGTSPVAQSGPNLFLQPQEWNNSCQDPFLQPCCDLPVDRDVWISSPCLHQESLWKPDDIGFVWVRRISPIVHVGTVTLEMQNTNIFLTVLNVLIIQRHGNTPETLFRLPVNHSSQLYKSRYYNTWEGTEKIDDSAGCRNKSNDSIDIVLNPYNLKGEKGSRRLY